MRELYMKELETLNIALTEMGGMCEESIRNSIQALLHGDQASAVKSIDYDKEIDRKEKEIEGACLQLIQGQQPVAGDLRFISSALKIITDMERIGDQAADIAEIVRIGNLSGVGCEKKLVQMSAEASKMVTDGIDAFVNRDTEKARRVIHYDDVVDDLFDEIKRDMVNILTRCDNKTEYVVDMLMIAKYFERIGDHATNIAEWAEYTVTGYHKGEKIL